MRLLNDGDRYNQISIAAAQFALASRWLFVRPGVMNPPIRPRDAVNHPMRRYRVKGQPPSEQPQDLI